MAVTPKIYNLVLQINTIALLLRYSTVRFNLRSIRWEICYDYYVIYMNAGDDMTARNISLRMDEENIDRVDRLASAMGRSRAWVLNQATKRYLEYEEWFVQQVEEGIEDIKRGNTVSNEQVLAEIRRKIEKA